MAVYRIFPEKDAFISSEIPTGNAGKDEIIEIGGYKDISEIGRTNRLLLQYSTSEIEDVVLNSRSSVSFSINPLLKIVEAL